MKKRHQYIFIVSFLVFVQFLNPEILLAQPDNIVCNDIYNGKAEIAARLSIRLSPGFKGIAGCDIKAWINPMLSLPILTYNPEESNLTSTISPDNSQNYIITSTLREAVTNSAFITQTRNVQTVEYFDGFGRLVQKVFPKGSPMQKDIVSALQYDNMGRLAQSYLPYVSSESNGAYKTNPYAECVAFYSQTQGSIAGREPDNVPFSIHHYDNSPLNRLTGEVMPGQDWTSHPATVNYKTNSTPVLHWSIEGISAPVSFNFPVNSLNVNEHIDVDGNTSRVYTDKLGRTVMQERVGDGNVTLKTSYIYDELGLLRCIVPPKNHDNGPSTDYCYYYKYDDQRRLIEKQLPGAEPVYYVYDKRDRLVMWQDGENRRDNLNIEWNFQLYDALNRPVITGVLISSADKDLIRSAFESYTGVLFESYVGSGAPLYGYTNTSFPAAYRPTLNNVHSVTYYDNYLFKSLFSGDYNFPQLPAGATITANYLSAAKGMVTGNLEVIASQNNMQLLSVTYYDEYLRVLCTVKDNHLNGRNNQFFGYSFDNLILERIETHTSDFQSQIVMRFNYMYDHAGRLLSERLTLDDQMPIVLQAMEYNELGELVNTYLHNGNPGTTGSGYNQKIKRSYNIQGWISKINDINEVDFDLFALDLRYQNTNLTNGLSSTPCFNGNISQMYSNGRFSLPFGYGFRYDRFNQLSEANYADENLFVGHQGSNNTSYSYDANGNLIYLERKRNNVMIDELTYNYGTWGNKVKSVSDIGTVDGYVPNTEDYLYDFNGNMTYDPSRKLSVSYNYQNLPVLLNFGPDDEIMYVYTPSGQKLSKTVSSLNTTTNNSVTDYCGAFIYNGKQLISIITSTGRLVPVRFGDELSWRKEYNLTDHLGNVRVVFAAHSNGQPEVMQQTSYYPFGYTLQQDDYYTSVSAENKNLYNGKELQDDVLAGSKLDWYDYGARMYDPQIGRWHVVDPVAEERQWLSPYNYCSLNPILRIDPTGALDGDYYNYDGTYLGSDGINDDKVYVVNSIDPETASKGMSSSDLLALRDKDFHSGSTDPSATLLSIKHFEFKAIAGTIYAEGSSTFGEAAGIYSVMRNRADAKGKSVYDIAGGGGIYGWSERDKINSPIANKDWAKNANLAVIEGVQGSKDYSGGAFYWHGKDFGLSSWKANKDYYQVGFNFTNTSHDLWNQGNKVSGNSGWDYKYQSTGAAGNTTFMKLTDDWIKANKYKGRW